VDSVAYISEVNAAINFSVRVYKTAFSVYIFFSKTMGAARES
jgi:hypothetical protein